MRHKTIGSGGAERIAQANFVVFKKYLVPQAVCHLNLSPGDGELIVTLDPLIDHRLINQVTTVSPSIFLGAPDRVITKKF